MFHGWRTLILNVLSFVGTVGVAHFVPHLDPVWVAGIMAALNIAKRYLAPTTAK